MLSVGRQAAAGLARPRLAPSVRATTTASLGPAALRRLLSALAVLEQRDGKLNLGSLSAVTAAKKLGGPVHAFVAGANIKPVAEEAAKVEGVEKIVAVENDAYEKVGVCGPIPVHRIRMSLTDKCVFFSNSGLAGKLRPAAG